MASGFGESTRRSPPRGEGEEGEGEWVGHHGGGDRRLLDKWPQIS